MADFEYLFFRILIQLVIVIAAARLGGILFRRMGQSEVVGEIAAGLVLGPSLLGQVSPDLLTQLFPSESTPIIRSVSELGLILLMFLIGLDFEFSHLRSVGRTAVMVAAAGCALPFTLGLLSALWLHPIVAADFDRTGFSLIVAVALSITAIPILGRIMVDFGLQKTAIGTLTITAAAIDDVLGWILLAAVSALIRGNLDVLIVLRMLTLTAVFVVAAGVAGRWICRRCDQWRWLFHDDHLSPTGLAAVLIIVLAAAATTSAIGIFAVFGPFVIGGALSGHQRLRQAVQRALNDFVRVFFLPVFFTYTGLRTNAGTLNGANEWLACGLLLLSAVGGKMIGCAVATRLGGFSWRDSGCVAIMMNTRALMGLITINVGRDLGVIPDSVFCMLVLMAVLTTLPTSPVLRRLLRGTDSETSRSIVPELSVD